MGVQLKVAMVNCHLFVFLMKRKHPKDLSAFPVLYSQYVFESRPKRESDREKKKPRLDLDYVWAALILCSGIGLSFSI